LSFFIWMMIFLGIMTIEQGDHDYDHEEH